jgi:glyoxylase-like metal-dependent hydrolase (beta-lactamase superfamily II)
VDEVADRVWVTRFPHPDIPNGVNAGIIGGERGLVVVDTLWSEQVACRIADPLAGDVVAVVNTHDHWDHVRGNGIFGHPIHAHEAAAEAMRSLEGVTLPDHTFSSVSSIDLGDRVVELLHPGRGHTAGDVVVRVADADVLFAGDLVEEGAPPSYGEDSFPLEWPATLDLLAELMGPSTVVVPGHGVPVDTAYVEAQRADQGVVAETIRDLATRRVPLAEALNAGTWPYDAELLEHAVRLGYAHLPRSARTLPLL